MRPVSIASIRVSRGAKGYPKHVVTLMEILRCSSTSIQISVFVYDKY